MINHSLLSFVVASVTVLLTPGPLMAYVVARTLHGGWRWGLWASLGICVADALHLGAALGGLGAMVAAAPDAARALQVVGALYLLVLGLRSLWPSSTQQVASSAATLPAPIKERQPWGVGCEACMLNLVNTQTVLFFLAFLPSFVSPTSAERPTQLVLLGSIFCGLNVVVLTAVVALAGTLRAAPVRSRWTARAARWSSGAVLIGLGGAGLWG